MKQQYKWCVVIGFLLFTGVAAGETVTLTAGVDNLLYYASDDTSTGDTVYASSYNGVGTSRDSGMNEFWVWESLIWFDIRSVMGKTIKKAELVLTPEVLAVDAYDNTYYYVAAVADPWNGNSVTSNNQPDIYTGWWVPFNVPTSTVPISLDVTDAVKYWADGTYPNYGFALKEHGGLHDYSYNYATFFGSIEYPGTTPPKLRIEVENGGGGGGIPTVVPSVIVPMLLF